MASTDDRRWGRRRRLEHGAVIREAREARGMSVLELAERAEMSKSTMSQVERGNVPLALRRVPMVAEAVGLTAEELLSAVLRDRLLEVGIDFVVIRCERPRKP